MRFASGARDASHRHAPGQTLHLTEGRGLIQPRGGAVTEVWPGDTIDTPPGECHRDGATPGHFMTHLAIWESPEQGPETARGDQVSDAEYRQR